MEPPVSPQVKPEPEPKLEASHGGQVKSERSDVLSMSHIPYRRSETTAGATPGEVEPEETNYLDRLCHENTSLESLETGISVAGRLLDQLRDELSTYMNRDVDEWIKAILDLEMRTAPKRTVVGVVGNTGAGKSSVINALLDEERSVSFFLFLLFPHPTGSSILVRALPMEFQPSLTLLVPILLIRPRLLPTNCLRACTASPTEISFNYSEDPEELYRAEIEFISIDEWVRELEVLYKDLLDGGGQISHEATKTDSDAGIAYAKVKAVYPQKTRETLAQANPKDLAKESAVSKILGTTKLLKNATAKELYQRMQHYVDSKEKSTNLVDNKKRVGVPMEYWPLIKVVRIFTKAHALSTGAVIVDLVG